jgi:hypothetical protein
MFGVKLDRAVGRVICGVPGQVRDRLLDQLNLCLEKPGTRYADLDVRSRSDRYGRQRTVNQA